MKLAALANTRGSGGAAKPPSHGGLRGHGRQRIRGATVSKAHHPIRRAMMALVTIVGAANARAQCEVDQFGIHRPPMKDGFGGRIAMSWPIAAIGDPNESGVVYVYHHLAGKWTLEAELTAPNPQPKDVFGVSVAMADEKVVIGAPGRDGLDLNQGAAYVFRRQAAGQWLLEAELTAADADYGDQFGYAVAVHGDLVVVGAPDDENGSPVRAGSAYVFRFIEGSWRQEAKFFDPEGADNDGFGVSVAVGSNGVLAGVPLNDDAGPGAGAAFVYRYEGSIWHLEAQLVPPGQPLVNLFGSVTRLSLDGSLAFIGAPQEDGQTGAVHVFQHKNGQWGHQVKLTAAEPVGPFPFFGSCLSLDPTGKTLLIGAPYDFANGFESGAAHLFRYEGSSDWREVIKLTGSDERPGDQFGCGLSLGGDVALIGATRNNAPGSVYAFAGMRGADCDGNGEPDGCDIFGGLLEDLDDDGIPDECEAGGDVNGDGVVGINDLLDVLAAWGFCPAPCPPGCLGDADGDCLVGLADLTAVTTGWGR